MSCNLEQNCGSLLLADTYDLCKFMKQNLTILPDNRLLQFYFYKNMYSDKLLTAQAMINDKHILH